MSPRLSRAGLAAYRIRYLAGVGVAHAGGGSAAGQVDDAGAAAVARRFSRAGWALYPDGRLLFAPAPGHGRAEVFPLAGRYEADGEGFRVRAERALGRGAGAAVRGVIEPAWPWRFRGHYDSRGAGRAVSLPVRVDLADPRSHPELLGVSLLAGVPTPLVFRVVLSGTVGAGAFGPLPADLTVVEAVAGSAERVEIMLSPPAGALDPTRLDVESDTAPGAGAVGEVQWLARAPHPGGARLPGRRVLVDGQTVEVCLRGGAQASLGVTVNVPAPYLGSVPTPARDARLTLRLRPAGAGRWQVEGRLTARTLAPSGGLAVDYVAAVRGVARVRTLDELAPASPAPAGPMPRQRARGPRSAAHTSGPAQASTGFAGPAWSAPDARNVYDGVSLGRVPRTDQVPGSPQMG